MKRDIPSKLRPMVALGFDYHESRVTGDEANSDCPFCGGKRKLYANVNTGQWRCMAGSCERSGNVVSFVQFWYQARLAEQDSFPEEWRSIAADRGIAETTLREAGLAWDGEQWQIPVFGWNGALVNLRRWRPGSGARGLPEFENQLMGAEVLGDEAHAGEPVYICEGEWDTLALRELLGKEGADGVVVGAPGASTWKDGWTEHFRGRDVVLAYDHDQAGERGVKRAQKKLAGTVRSFKWIRWPDVLAEGYDVRDFAADGADFAKLCSLLDDFSDEPVPTTSGDSEAPAPLITEDNGRPKFEEVIQVFARHLHLSGDMVDALKVIFAVVLSNQIEGDPLWVHIVSPPGTAKTELLMPLTQCASCYFASTVTPHSLVSGFATAGNGDPSLLPKLHGKTFILKDFTEILNMPRVQKDEIYATLRGAYDGSVEKPFGNGLIRRYDPIHFNMLSGVTHSVFGERSASLGERFLLFHLVKGVGQEAGASIRAAIRNVGKERTVRADLQDVVRDFLQVTVPREAVPEMPEWMEDRVVALASIVSMLRASVEKTYVTGQEKLLYRPQHEMGTRLAKQLSKLAYGLSLVNSPPSLGENEYQIVRRVALDTCVGFNLEAVAHLAIHGTQRVEQLCLALDLPHSTLRDQLEDMAMLGALERERQPNPTGRGAPIHLYKLSKIMELYWERAGMNEAPEISELPEQREVVRSIKRVRKRTLKVD